MTAVRSLADRYLEQLARLEPTLATALGSPFGQDALPDLSPEVVAEQVSLAASSLRELATLADEDDIDRRCRGLMEDRLGLVASRFDAGEHLRPLSVIAGAPAEIQGAFELMAKDTDDDWANVGKRIQALPGALASMQASLAEGVRRGVLAAPRQALATAQQLSTWAGLDGSVGYFAGLAASAPDPLRGTVGAGVSAANHALADLAVWLRSTYAPAAAHVPDAVGRDRYVVSAREFLGGALDPDEAYSWGWAELERIETEMQRVAHEILPGATIDEAMAWLDVHGEAAEGEVELQRFLQTLMDDTIAAMHGTYFDLAAPIRTVEAMIAPPGGAAAQYYTPPSADFSRPGRTWYPTMGKTRFPIWNEVSTCYHEGVPGHHLQIAQWIYLAPQMSLFQGTFFISGNGEGWALYAERLMDELGFLSDPGRRLGYLVAQQLRATRVVVDIGMHLAMPIPTGQPFHPGERFTPELGREFMGLHAGKDIGFLDSEWERYLGWPGQAICYKLGERVWLAGRDAARRRAVSDGRTFDQKSWHMAALSMGSTGLDQLAAELPLL
jgi:hypothetical protein